MLAMTVKTTIRQVYQYLNGGRESYNRALAFGVRYPGLVFGNNLTASPGFIAYMRASVAKMQMDSLLIAPMLDADVY